MLMKRSWKVTKVCVFQTGTKYEYLPRNEDGFLSSNKTHFTSIPLLFPGLNTGKDCKRHFLVIKGQWEKTSTLDNSHIKVIKHKFNRQAVIQSGEIELNFNPRSNCHVNQIVRCITWTSRYTAAGDVEDTSYRTLSFKEWNSHCCSHIQFKKFM